MSASTVLATLIACGIVIGVGCMVANAILWWRARNVHRRGESWWSLL